MHDLNRTMFYKTSFHIETKTPGEDVLWQLVMSIRHWMVGKWNRASEVVPAHLGQWSDFKSGGCFCSNDEGKSVRFESAVFWDEPAASQWACSITETSVVLGCAHRQWITEIGFEKTAADAGDVSVVLTYADQPGYLGPRQPAPDDSVPRIVRILNENRRLACSLSGLPLQLEAEGLAAGDFPKFWSIVSDPNRSIPVVYISPRLDEQDQLEYLLNPFEVGRSLGASALVYYGSELEFCNEMTHGLPSWGLRCANGTVRVYAAHPRIGEVDDELRHRFFTPDDIEAMGAQALADLLRQVFAQDVNFYEHMVRVDTVKLKVRRASLEKSAQRRIDTVEQEAIDMASSIEDELLMAQLLSDELARANEELESDNYRLMAKNAALETQLRGAGSGGSGFGRAPDLGRWPLSPRQVLDVFLRAFPDKLAATQRCLRSVEECTTAPEVVWNALFDLCAIGHPLFAGPTGVDVAREFNSRSTFEYARSAGMMTRKDKGLMAAYDDTFEGRTILAEPHLKNGVKESDDKFIRVYFAYDAVSGKIVLSHIGKHLANYTGRFMK